MAAHYILHGSTLISSHNFSTVHLERFLKKINDEEHTVTLHEESSAMYKMYDPTDDYKSRPLELERLSLYKYTK